MKKLYILIIGLFLLLPFNIKAAGIGEYYIDATVLSNGDLKVKEIFYLNGAYNGFERIINYKGTVSKNFSGDLESFKGSTIYNGSDILIEEVAGVKYKKPFGLDFSESDKTMFNEVPNALSGDYGKYIVSKTNRGYKYKIYNPRKKSNAFYLEYTIKDMGIVHGDVAEIGWNLFDELSESVGKLVVTIHIPNNKKELRVWGHGPLNGESKIIDKETIELRIDNFDAYTKIDTRFVFDKEVLSESIKKTNVESLYKIITAETEWAEEANRERESLNKHFNITLYIIIGVINYIFLRFLIIAVKDVRKEHDKEYKSLFKKKYLREIPSDYSPSTVGYLINKKISDNDLSACILYLVDKKIVDLEEDLNDKNNYILKSKKEEKMEEFEKLNESDKILHELLFEKQSIISIKEIEKDFKKRYKSFIKKYEEWKAKSLGIAISEGFYEDKNSIKVKKISTFVILILIMLVVIIININPILNQYLILDILISLISIIYFSSIQKRTKKGNDEYKKWMALKKFMKDFGRMDEKDLPEIHLWRKYLVYALTLGCADKLSKTMKLKLEELNMDDAIVDLNQINLITNFNTNINSTINKSISNAHYRESSRSSRGSRFFGSSKSSSSSSSSGSGGGGGFSGGSSGGGSFGGGGGGGRF